MPMQHFIEGIDPTLNTNPVTKADLVQLARNMKPVENEGQVIWAQDAPNVVLYPELAGYLWGALDEDGKKTGDFYYYEDGSWQPLPIVDGSKLANNSVPLNKLNADGAAAYDIIQRNAANNSWVIVSIPTAVQSNSLSPDKLTAPDNTNDYVLVSQAGIKAFVPITTVLGLIANGGIAISKIAPGTALQVLRTNAGGTTLEWADLDLSNIDAAGASAGQSPRRNGSNTGWEYYTPGSSLTITPLTNGGAYWVLPATGAAQSIPHTLGVVPKFARVVLIKMSTDTDGYAVGNEIDPASIVTDEGADFQQPLFTIGFDATNIVVASADHSGGMWINKKGGGSSAFDPSTWKLKAYVIA